MVQELASTRPLLRASNYVPVVASIGTEHHIHRDGNGDLVVPVIGVPFGGSEERDLYGEWFDKNTDLGPLMEGISYFDHQMDWLYVPDSIEGFGTRYIGKTMTKAMTEEGLLEYIIIQRRERYIDMLERLARSNLLSVSSMANYASYDPLVNGRIAEWHKFATDFTPTPAEINARIVNNEKSLRFNEKRLSDLVGIVKHFGFDLKPKALSDWDGIHVINIYGAKSMPTGTEDKKNEEAEINADVDAAMDAAIDEVVNSVAGDTPENPEPQNGSEEGKNAPSYTELLELVKSMSEKIDTLTTDLAKAHGEVKDIQISLPTLIATNVAKSFAKFGLGKSVDFIQPIVPETPSNGKNGSYKGINPKTPGLAGGRK